MVNFFYLSKDLKKCARWHGDKHLHKMVTEYAQILSTCWHYSVHQSHCDLRPNCGCKLKVKIPDGVYKVAHRKHPTVLWCKTNIKHFNAVLSLAQHLADERRHRNLIFIKLGLKRRYTEYHKSEDALRALSDNPPEIPDSEWLDPPLAMPEVYKNLNLSAVESYRTYYAGHKVQVVNLKWFPESEPDWLAEYKAKITPEIQSVIDIALKDIEKNKLLRAEAKGNILRSNKETKNKKENKIKQRHESNKDKAEIKFESNANGKNIWEDHKIKKYSLQRKPEFINKNGVSENLPLDFRRRSMRLIIKDMSKKN